MSAKNVLMATLAGGDRAGNRNIVCLPTKEK